MVMMKPQMFKCGSYRQNNFFLQNMNMDWTGFEALIEKQLDGHLLGIIHERNNSKSPEIL